MGGKIMIALTNPKHLTACTKHDFINMELGLRESMEVYIRRQFDAALIDSTALGAIELAIKNGFSDLANEMIQDLYAETGQIALAPFNFSSLQDLNS